MSDDILRTYPVTVEGDTDARFTFGLTVDVSRVLEEHGYPPFDGQDFAALQVTLFRFLYRPSP